MGTNFYLHLGKRTAAPGSKCTFTAAVDLPGLAQFPGVTVIDEYGHEMTLQDFWGLIANDFGDREHIGQRFS